MDPVTHTLSGVALANAFFRKRFGPEAVPILAWAANLPDIDSVTMLTGRLDAIILRRTFGHSLVLLPLWVAGLAWLFKRRYPGKRYGDILALVALGAATHVLFDLINSFGVVLLWPLSLWRPELATTFIIDLLLTGLLAFPLFLGARKEAASRLSAGLVAAYLLVSGVLRASATALLAADRAREGRAASFSYVFPEPFGPRRWRGVEKDGGAWRIYLVDAVSRSVDKRLERPDQAEDPAARAAAATPLGREIAGFVKAPVWEVEDGPEGTRRARVSDLRFTTLLLKRRTPFIWSFDVSPDGTAVPGKPRI